MDTYAERYLSYEQAAKLLELQSTCRVCRDVIWAQTAILPAVETFSSPYRARLLGDIVEPSAKHPLKINWGQLHSPFSAEQELLKLNSFWMYPHEY